LDYGARYYDARLSRFLSVDPLASDYPEWSPYSYVHNNPLIHTDPTGMSPDTLKVGYVMSGPGMYHLNIIDVDNDTGEENVIVEGFPANEISDPMKILKDGWGNLVRNEQTDPSSIENKEVLDIPDGMTEEEFKNELLKQASSYDNSVPYNPLPGNPDSRIDNGNSNSLIGSVLRAAGSDFEPSRISPGFKINVLPGNRVRKARPTFIRFGEGY